MGIIDRLARLEKQLAESEERYLDLRDMLVFHIMRDEFPMTSEQAVQWLDGRIVCACYGAIGELRDVAGAPCGCETKTIIANAVLGRKPRGWRKNQP